MAVNVKPGEMFEASAPVALFKTGIQRTAVSGSYGVHAGLCRDA